MMFSDLEVPHMIPKDFEGLVVEFEKVTDEYAKLKETFENLEKECKALKQATSALKKENDSLSKALKLKDQELVAAKNEPKESCASLCATSQGRTAPRRRGRRCARLRPARPPRAYRRGRG